MTTSQLAAIEREGRVLRELRPEAHNRKPGVGQAKREASTRRSRRRWRRVLHSWEAA